MEIRVCNKYQRELWERERERGGGGGGKGRKGGNADFSSSTPPLINRAPTSERAFARRRAAPVMTRKA